MPLAQLNAAGIIHYLYGLDYLRKVEQRLAHAHEYDIAYQRVPGVFQAALQFTPGAQQLTYYFAGRQIALKHALTGGAKRSEKDIPPVKKHTGCNARSSCLIGESAPSPPFFFIIHLHQEFAGAVC